MPASHELGVAHSPTGATYRGASSTPAASTAQSAFASSFRSHSSGTEATRTRATPGSYSRAVTLQHDGRHGHSDKLPGIDQAGYAGLEDGVDWHWGRILAGAALATMLGVSSELAVSDQGSTNGNVVIALRNSAQDTTNQVGQEITRRNLSIQPTLTVRQGFPMDVMVNKDLLLRPYHPCFFRVGHCNERGNSPATTWSTAQDRNRQAHLYLHRRSEGGTGTLRVHALAGVWRIGRCADANSAYAGGVHGAGPGIQSSTWVTRFIHSGYVKGCSSASCTAYLEIKLQDSSKTLNVPAAHRAAVCGFILPEIKCSRVGLPARR